MSSSLKVILLVSCRKALSALTSAAKYSILALETMLTTAFEAMLSRASMTILHSLAVSSSWSNRFLNLELLCKVVMATVGKVGLSSLSSPESVQ